MKKKTGVMVGLFVGIGLAILLLVIGGLYLTQNFGKSQDVISQETADSKLAKLIQSIAPESIAARKESVELVSTTSKTDELPDIDTSYPLTVEGTGELNIEIFSSPEKAGDGTDGWLNEVAEKFNRKSYEIDGKKVAVSIRNISSGTMVEYIASGKYIPEAISPSNILWAKMLTAEGVNIELVSERLAGNVPGILLSEDKYNELMDKYGAINMKTIIQATVDEEIIMGYTNPLASSTGLNFLLNTLYSYDASNLFSDTAIEGFHSFQNNVPFVAFTTIQMRDAAESGSLDGFLLEYQSYINDKDLQLDYVFTPFGVRHDEPVYSMGNLSEEKTKLLNQFVEYCLNDENQNLATEYGFNGLNDYISETPDFDGDTIIKSQKLWKENKDGDTTILAVFVTDISGSMAGEPMNALKQSLINGMQYINENAYIGLASYNDKVYINLPIEKFDLNQQAYFKGAVTDLVPTNGTATFDGIAVGIHMLLEAMEEYPDAKPMLFVLSDGDSNTGCSLDDVRGILEAYSIPVYTIGYNADIEALEKISSINEAASINADTEDVIYKLKNLFNAEL